MGIDITAYRIRIGRFGPCMGYISTGIAEIYSSSITWSDIHYRMLTTTSLLTFLLKCCVMTQQERIMQELNSFAGTDQCQLLEYGPYSYICKSIYLYTIIKAVRPPTYNVVRNAFGHLIRAPHHFQTLGWTGFIYGLMIGMGPKCFLSTMPTPTHCLKIKVTDLEVYSLINSIIFPRIKSNQLTSHKSNLNDNNKRTSHS